jgi:hypothetical protein
MAMAYRPGSTRQNMRFEAGLTSRYMLSLEAFEGCFHLRRRYDIVIRGYQLHKLNLPKVGEFYFIRYVLAFVCAVCQTQLFRVISNTLNPRIALFFLMAMIFSPGMFNASVAYLPSSFAMYTTMLGMAAFINWRGGLKTAQGIFWFAVGGILGWPFSVALCAPFLVEEVLLATFSSKDAFIDAIMRFFRGIVASLLVLVRVFCSNPAIC